MLGTWLTRFWHKTRQKLDMAMVERLTHDSFFILDALSTGPKHGTAIIVDLDQCHHVWLLSLSVFATLDILEKRGWIVALPAEDRRQPYRMTPQGRDILRMYQARAQASSPA